MTDLKAQIQSIYPTLYPSLVRFIKGRVSSTEVAQDIASHAFEKALTANYNDQGTIEAWIYKIAKNLIIDYYRLASTKTTVSNQDLVDQQAGYANVESQAEINWNKSKLNQLLQELADIDKTIIEYKFFLGYSNKQIANLINLTETNVSTKVQRSIAKLKAMANS